LPCNLILPKWFSLSILVPARENIMEILLDDKNDRQENDAKKQNRRTEEKEEIKLKVNDFRFSFIHPTTRLGWFCQLLRRALSDKK
jgi:hypothetical protein